MEWSGPADDAYDERRALFNAMIDKRPRLIARCADAADAAAAVVEQGDDAHGASST